MIDNRFYNAQSSKTSLETINTFNGEWPENGQIFLILDELLEIETFLWINRQESDEIFQLKVREAIKLSKKNSGGKRETHSKGR